MKNGLSSGSIASQKTRKCNYGCAGGRACRVETWRGSLRMLRFHVPLIEPDGRISRIRLSEKVMPWPTGSGLYAR